MFRKKHIVSLGGMLFEGVEFVKNGDKLNKIEAVVLEDNDDDWDQCFDIGVGQDNSEGFTTVDIDASCEPDFVGDIRCLFAPSEYYKNMLKDYSDMLVLDKRKFGFVRAKHVIEHIEWIYLPTLFEWFAKMIHVGGILSIDTPNLEYIAKMYLVNLDKQINDQQISFPENEHPDINNLIPEDMQRWINFKIFSGCSPGDYHHSCLDTTLLVYYLKRSGFDRIIIYNGTSLRAIAYRSSEEPAKSLDDLINEIISGGQ